MNILYVAYRHDPRDPDAASGSDYNFLKALQNCFQVDVLGPFREPPVLPERIIKRLYQSWTRSKFLKFNLSNAYHTSKVLERTVADNSFDAVFSIFPAPFIFYRGAVPFIFRLDTTFYGQQLDYPIYGDIALKMAMWQERKVFCKAAKIVTHSEWCKRILLDTYGLQPEKVDIFPNPSALPETAISPTLRITEAKLLQFPLRLLLVGREHERKGIDKGIQVAEYLNMSGLPTILTICGTKGNDTPQIRFVGPYRKSVPNELNQYLALYERAHFLLHPATFEAAGIVPSEAAAFGTPTITNDTGGLGTTVKNGVSGVVLPKHSSYRLYAEKIIDFVAMPTTYYELCESTRQRYEDELNWTVAQERLRNIIERVVEIQVADRN